ncbi:MAG: phosphatidate cytidylyltransferase [Gammaproteobacteria bacterium]|nr:phosphatidate cytidylyltransferase [Gammaproteobacteria bacterium]
MLRLRVMTALAMFAAIVSAVVWLDTQWLGLALGVIILTGAWEWGALSGLRSPGAKIAYVAGMAVLALATVSYLPDAALPAVGCLWWLLVTARILVGQAAVPLQGRVSRAWLAAGPMTLLPAYSAILYLHRSDSFGAVFLLYAMSIVWVADIGAYFTGRRWGMRKLAPAISPGKSWEGAAGALALVTAYGVVGGWWFSATPTAAALLVIVAMAAGLVSIIGDLFESLLKRAAQRKDSGTLLPGHGGVLDRIDSLTAAMPVFASGSLVLPVI